MIRLFQPPGAWGLPSIGPFCVKLETWLRLAGLSYDTRGANIRKAPKGKVPYVSLDGSLMGDSQLIIQRLSARAPQLDAGLDDLQRAQAHALRRMLDEATYFVLVYLRWIPDDGFAAYKPVLLTIMPRFIGGLIAALVRRGVRKSLHSQGLGRHSLEEIAAIGIADIGAVEAQLGDKPYLFGDEPGSVDASAFAMLSGILYPPINNPVKAHIQSRPRLMDYVARIHQRCFPELTPGG